VNNNIKHSYSSSKLDVVNNNRGIELSNVFYDDTDMAFSAWEWQNGLGEICMDITYRTPLQIIIANVSYLYLKTSLFFQFSLGAPAALIAGAVLVTFMETREDYAPKSTDSKWVRIGKLLYRFLLASSFRLEVVSIFVSTVTGSVLLGHGQATKAAAVGYTSCLGLLHHHHEFEFLTIQIGFLQGLLHWLYSVALDLFIPKENEDKSARRMNIFLASCLTSLCVWILAFYNHHLNFYSDYAHMLRRYCILFFQRYIWSGKNHQFRPLSLIYIPAFIRTIYLGWRAFTTPPNVDDED